MIKITLNNNTEYFDKNMTINELLTYKKFTFKMLVISINGNLVKRDEYDSSIVKEGDNVSIIHLISGG